MGSIIRRFVSNGSGASAHTAQGTEIHWLPAGRIAPEVIAGVPSVHAAWHGSYPLCVDGHTLKLEEEVFLPLADQILGRDPNHMAALDLSIHLRRAPAPSAYI